MIFFEAVVSGERGEESWAGTLGRNPGERGAGGTARGSPRAAGPPQRSGSTLASDPTLFPGG